MWYILNNTTKKLTKLVKSRKNNKFVYKKLRINQSNRFIDIESDKNE